jgi:hypothetical protein
LQEQGEILGQKCASLPLHALGLNMGICGKKALQLNSMIGDKIIS